MLEQVVPEWYPVKVPFDLIHAFTDPLREMPVVEKQRKRDAIVRRFSDVNLSAYVRVEILPRDPGETEHLKLHTECVMSVGPDYCVRTAIYHHDAVSACLFVRGPREKS